MKTIWKFRCPIHDELALEMPFGAEVLCVQTQYGEPCIWALVDSNALTTERKFAWRGTGHNCDGLAIENRVGTVQMGGGQLVFHLFEIR